MQVADMKEGYRQTVATLTKGKEGTGARLSNDEWPTGPSRTILPCLGMLSGLCPVGTSPGREACISWLWGWTGEGIECFWLDAGTSSSEVQVLEIRSMMTAGIRATLSLIDADLASGDDGS